MILGKDNIERLPPPVGTSDWATFSCEARRQIDGKKYDTTFRAEGIADIVKIGLAYHKNKVAACKNE